MATPIARESFTSQQKILHWAVVVLLLLQYVVFDGIGWAFRELMKTGTHVYTNTALAHMTIGILILLLASWRIVLRIRDGVPPPPEAEPNFGRLAGKVTHGLLYVCLFALPVVGLGAWFLKSRTLAELHETGTNVLLLLIGIHIVAVAVHQFWWRTGLLSRMT
ncbi:MAG: cytochrome b/b6 domain-containing protein [Rhodobacteraceae bacterium]|nr:cytochrome b/b6 domain-containing protein [Paracoccaceae bacterium]